MTRREFEAIAASVRFMILPANARNEVSERLADTLALSNPRFDRDKFIDKCQP